MPGFTGTKSASNTALTETKQALVTAMTNAGVLIWDITACNPDAASVTFIQFFDAASGNVTVGSTTPTFVLALGPKTVGTVAYTNPREFRTAVTVACTSTATGAGAPATAAVLSIGYTPA